MKKIFKTLLLTILALVLGVCAFACGNDGGDENKTGLLYKKRAGENFYTVYSYVDDGSAKTALDIAEYNKDGIVIGRIEKGAFAGNDTLTSIVVPSTVTEIEGGAFEKMKKLTEITLPFIGNTAISDLSFNASQSEENKSVDAERTFGYLFGTEEYVGGAEVVQNHNSSDSGTTTYYMPASLKKVTVNGGSNYGVPMFAFSGNRLIQQVVLSNVVAIGEYAFENCSSLVNVNVPNTVTKIYKNAFDGCANLKDAGFVIDANSTLATIGEYAFKGTGLNNLTLPTSVTAVEKGAFASSKLVNVNLSNVATISEGAFRGCQNLTTVTANSVIKIQAYAFEGCKVLATFGATANKLDMANITELGVWAFANANVEVADLINVTLSNEIVNTALGTV